MKEKYQSLVFNNNTFLNCSFTNIKQCIMNKLILTMLIFAFFFAQTIPSFSQKNFIQAIKIKIQSGYIDYRNWENQHHQVYAVT
jgi:hypothetical protein